MFSKIEIVDFMKMPWMSYKKIINFWKSENTGDNGHQNHVFFNNYHFERAYMSRKRVFRKKWKYEITLLSWTEILKISWKHGFPFFALFLFNILKHTVVRDESSPARAKLDRRVVQLKLKYIGYVFQNTWNRKNSSVSFLLQNDRLVPSCQRFFNMS